MTPSNILRSLSLLALAFGLFVHPAQSQTLLEIANGVPCTGAFCTATAPLSPTLGGTGVANNAASLITITGAFGTTLTVTGTTALTLPTSGTVTAQGNTVTGSGSIVLATAPTIASLNVTASNTAVASSVGLSDNSNLPQITGYGTGGATLPTGISFQTCKSDGTGCSENMRISNAGALTIGGNFTASGAAGFGVFPTCYSNTGVLTDCAAATQPVRVFSKSGTSTASHIVKDTATLSTGTVTVTFSGNAVFASSSSYVCNGNDTSGVALAVSSVNTSGTVTVFFGTASDVITYTCIGN